MSPMARIFPPILKRNSLGSLEENWLSSAEFGVSCRPVFGRVAHVAELVDALDSGSSGVKPVEVRVLS